MNNNELKNLNIDGFSDISSAEEQTVKGGDKIIQLFNPFSFAAPFGFNGPGFGSNLGGGGGVGFGGGGRGFGGFGRRFYK